MRVPPVTVAIVPVSVVMPMTVPVAIAVLLSRVLSRTVHSSILLTRSRTRSLRALLGSLTTPVANSLTLPLLAATIEGDSARPSLPKGFARVAGVAA